MLFCPSLRELDADDVTALGCEIDFRVSPTVSPGLVKDLRREIEYQIAPDDGHASPIIRQPHYASTASSKFSLSGKVSNPDYDLSMQHSM